MNILSLVFNFSLKGGSNTDTILSVLSCNNGTRLAIITLQRKKGLTGSQYKLVSKKHNEVYG